jgi:glutathionylspermidine synthase
MKILWDLYPNHPLLLETSFEPLKNKKQVIKPTLAREGENVEIVDENGQVIAQEDGEYQNFKKVYQEFTELEKDNEGNYYQAGVFFAYEACGLGYRKGNLILNNMSKFITHIVEE